LVCGRCHSQEKPSGSLQFYQWMKIASPPLITLTTDFGLADHYAGTMKGVLLSRCRDARLVDISHEIPAFSIYSGAYVIDQAAPYFPPGTIHVIVVDPGVGTSRKPLLMKAIGQYFVAPDNGVLSLVAARDGATELREIANRNLWLGSPSSTFHGRDIFAPVAAALASGHATEEDVGPLLPKMELLPHLEPEQVERDVWRGTLLSVDRFGNVITNFKVAQFAGLATQSFVFEAGDGVVTEFRPTFGNAPQGLCFAYFGSSGRIEFGMNQASAAAVLRVAAGDSISLRTA
jgi:S-adenosyl-L-methionine hydrolase (adenosine-forming)